MIQPLKATDILLSLDNAIKVLKPRLPEESASQVAARDISKVLDRPALMPTEEQISKLYERICDAIENRTLDDLPANDWLQSPWVLWHGDQEIAKSRRFVRKMLHRFEQKSSSAALARLAYVYMRDFEARKPAIKDVAKALRRIVSRSHFRSALKWKERDDRANIFDPSSAARRIAVSTLVAPQPIERSWSDLGINGELIESGGLARAAYAAMLTEVYGRLRSGKLDFHNLDNFLKFSRVGRKLRYRDQSADIAGAVLLPWVDSKEPPHEIREQIHQFIIHLYGDPRVSTTKWHGVSREALAVIARWLTRETLDLFFEIIDRHALQSHWKYRKAFWLAYHRKGAIDDAWLALGPSAREHAKMTSQQLSKQLSFGELLGAASDQSVLILKIDSITVAEWTHNGKCRVWDADDGEAPNLNQDAYYGPNLRVGSHIISRRYTTPGIAHFSSEAGLWQGMLEKFIRRKTGKGITAKEYMSGV